MVGQDGQSLNTLNTALLSAASGRAGDETGEVLGEGAVSIGEIEGAGVCAGANPTILSMIC